MKIKYLIWAFCLTLMVVVPFGCKETDTPKNMQREDGPYAYRDYAFEEVLVPTKIKLGLNEEPGEPPVLYVDIDGPIHSVRKGYEEGLPQMQEFRQRVGDIYRHQYYERSHYPMLVLSRSITSLSVETVEDYNEDYRSGASPYSSTCLASGSLVFR